MSFEDDIDAAQSAPIDFRDVPIELNGKLHTFRFLQLSGIEWATETDKHPARPGVLVDTRYGYNLRTLCLAVAKIAGRRVEGDTLVEIPPERWDQLFKTAGGGPVARMCDAIWELNEYAPAEAVEAAKKAHAELSATASS